MSTKFIRSVSSSRLPQKSWIRPTIDPRSSRAKAGMNFLSAEVNTKKSWFLLINANYIPCRSYMIPKKITKIVRFSLLKTKFKKEWGVFYLQKRVFKRVRVLRWTNLQCLPAQGTSPKLNYMLCDAPLPNLYGLINTHKERKNRG